MAETWAGIGFVMAMIGVFIAIAVVGISLAVYGAKKRREAWQAFATRHGFECYANGGPEAIPGSATLGIFQLGRSRRVNNMARRIDEDLGRYYFDYQYTTGGGKNSHTSQTTMAAFHFPGPVLPVFTLATEGFFHKIGDMIGFDDIDFETHEEFSRQFRLKGPDEPSIRRLFDPGTLTLLEGEAGWTVDCCGDVLLVYRHGSQVKPEMLDDFVATTGRILEIFRRRVRR